MRKKISNQKMLNCLNEIFNSSIENDGFVINISSFPMKHNVTKIIPVVLQKLGYVKKIGYSSYKYVGKKPTPNMVLKIKKYISEIQQNYTKKFNNVETTVKPSYTKSNMVKQIINKSIIIDSHKISNIDIKKILDLAKKADLYNISDEMKPKFIQDFIQ
jgi:hypothetical protein